MRSLRSGGNRGPNGDEWIFRRRASRRGSAEGAGPPAAGVRQKRICRISRFHREKGHRIHGRGRKQTGGNGEDIVGRRPSPKVETAVLARHLKGRRGRSACPACNSVSPTQGSSAVLGSSPHHGQQEVGQLCQGSLH